MIKLEMIDRVLNGPKTSISGDRIKPDKNP